MVNLTKNGYCYLLNTSTKYVMLFLGLKIFSLLCPRLPTLSLSTLRNIAVLLADDYLSVPTASGITVTTMHIAVYSRIQPKFPPFRHVLSLSRHFLPFADRHSICRRIFIYELVFPIGCGFSADMARPQSLQRAF